MSTPRFITDEDFRAEIVAAVRRLEPGIEIVSVRDLGWAGSKDNVLVERAHAAGYLLLSHDVNTLKPVAVARVLDGRGVSGVFSSPRPP